MVSCCCVATMLGVLPALASPATANANDSVAQGAEKARAILEKHCGDCHGPEGDEKRFVEPTLGSLVTLGRVVPGNPGKSKIIQRIVDPDAERRMPKDAPPLADDEVEVIRSWIEKGATSLKPHAAPPATGNSPAARAPLGPEYAIAHVHAHLRGLPLRDRAHQRYFTLLNLRNRGDIREQDLRTTRAAVSKALNSLSWQRDLAIPVAIDPEELILAIDLRQLEWQEEAMGRPDIWRQIARFYPYGLKHTAHPDDERSREQWSDIDEWTGTQIPWMRADWFVTNALQPPIYHEVLFDLVHDELRSRDKVEVELADKSRVFERRVTDRDVERILGIGDFTATLRGGRAIRSGNTISNVSLGPRILERVPTRYGAYWKSYDFRPGNVQKPATDIATHPLGPPGAFPEFAGQSFEQDGGEIVFNLPNGLQGYLLIDSKGNRISVGPIDVVRDKVSQGGDAQIINGISCIACHADGMKDDNTTDTIRGAVANLPGRARDAVRQLYVDPDAFRRELVRDQKRFQDAVTSCVSPFLGPDAGTEPVATVWSRHMKPIGLAEVAAELGVTPERAARDLDDVDLGAVVTGNRIQRIRWEQREVGGVGASLFQRAAAAIKDIGTPVDN